MGSDKYLEEIAQLVSIPVLRKDFTIDSYMIYEAKAMKADGVLLICALLDDETLRNYLALTKKLGMSALVEAHSGTEVSRALKAGASVIGVNNRDLKTFHVDLNTSLRLRTMVPRNKIFVAESGIKDAGGYRGTEQGRRRRSTYWRDTDAYGRYRQRHSGAERGSR